MRLQCLKFFLSVFVSFFLTQTVWAQTCSNCTDTYHNYTGSIKVKNNERVCITGTFHGDIELSGGTVTICGSAVISDINYKKASMMIMSESAIVDIQTVNSNKEVTMVNYSDSLIIRGGNFNQPFTLTNNGKCYLNGGAFNSSVTLTNHDTLIVNTSLTLNGTLTFNNTSYFVVNGNFTPNSSSVTINNQCQMRINGDLMLNGQTLTVGGGNLHVNNVNINSGKIILNESSILYVNNLAVNGYIEGTGSRSSLVCTQNPNLNGHPSIKGNLSLCVRTGNFTPNSGAVAAPATVDCDNPIPASACNPEGFGYAFFRMAPQQSADWTNSATWEMLYSNGWAAAPAGRYPTTGTAVLIGDGKTMTVTGRSVSISKLVLGESTTGGKLILDSMVTRDFNVEDSVVSTPQSQIELKASHLILNGRQDGDLNLKGSEFAKLTLNLQSVNGVLRMNQSVPGQSNKLQTLTYQLSGPNPVEIADTLRIVSSVIPNGGVLKTNDKLILESNASSTAYIAQGADAGNYIQGKVTVEQYIPAVARRYRFVTSSINGGNLLDWQHETFVTGNNAAGTATGNTIGQLNSAGFDATSNNNPSLFYYDETLPGDLDARWVAVTNETNTLSDAPLPVGRGYRLFIRGDRSDYGRLDGSVTDQNEVTMDLRGTPNQGDITVPVTYTTGSPYVNDNGWNLIGNPYPCNIDFKAMFKDSALHYPIYPIVWTFDATKNTYVSYNALSGAGSLESGIIPAGQAFWVKTDGPVSPVIFKEQYKTAQSELYVQRSDDVRMDELKVVLNKDSINEDLVVLKYLPDASLEHDKYDISKFWGGEMGLSFLNQEDGAYLGMSVRPVRFRTIDHLQLYFYVATTGDYELKFDKSPNRLAGYTSNLLLIDQYVDTMILVTPHSSYPFTVDLNTAASKDPLRFKLLFIPTDPPPALVNYFYGEMSDTSTVLLEWGSLREPIPTTYIVQRGLSATDFISLGTIGGTGTLETTADYSYLDSTVNGYDELYYRIAYFDTLNTELQYTPIIRVNMHTGLMETIDKNARKYVVYPNPANSILHVRSINGQTDVRISVMDITGKLWMNDQALNMGSVDISELPAGLYIVQLVDAGGTTERVKIVKE